MFAGFVDWRRFTLELFLRYVFCWSRKWTFYAKRKFCSHVRATRLVGHSLWSFRIYHGGNGRSSQRIHGRHRRGPTKRNYVNCCDVDTLSGKPPDFGCCEHTIGYEPFRVIVVDNFDFYINIIGKKENF